MKQPSLLKGSEDWAMAGVWNATLGGKPEREAKPRDHIWASELGKANIDIFLKLKGVEASNPPNDRAKRKFAAGRLFEWIVQVMLSRAGILISAQDWIAYQYPGLIEVTGKLDFIAGGVPDYTRWDQWEDLMKKLDMPAEWLDLSHAFRELFSGQYPEGLAETILEIKSCSAFAMNAMEKTGRSSRNHRLQDFHYLKAKNHPLGRVVYVCRDDLRMFEVAVRLDDEKIEAEYHDAIQQITVFYNNHKDTPLDKFILDGEEGTKLFNWMEGMPPLEQYILWDDDWGKFTRNWGVEYSNYLTMLYGFATQLEFEEAVNPTVLRWNSCITRLKKIKKREMWLLERNHEESEIIQDKIEGSRKKGPQYVLVAGEKVFLPEEISGSIALSPGNIESIESITKAGFKVEELVEKMPDDVTEEVEETA